MALGFVLVLWADGEFLRREPIRDGYSNSSRPDWVSAWYDPYRRLQHDWIWACVAVTVGAGAVLALDPETWRRPLPPGTTTILAILLDGGVTVLHYFLAAPAIFRMNGDCYGLRDTLEFRVPGVILGAWVVT